jgi:hypothetical protein
MSYTTSPNRIKTATFRDGGPSSAKRGSGSRSASSTSRKAKGTPFDEPTDWKKVLLIGAAVAAGAGIGAGAALLITDMTGSERRALIGRRARRVGHRAEHAWDDLAFELREAARSARNRLRRRHHHADVDDDADDN